MRANVVLDDERWSLVHSSLAEKIVTHVYVVENMRSFFPEVLREKESIFLNVCLSNDNRIKEINSYFLSERSPTDVLSFCYWNDTKTCEKGNCILREEGFLVGEMIISFDRIRENAVFLKEDFSVNLIRVIVHGSLHILGYDHQKEIQRNKMREEEDVILSTFGNFFCKYRGIFSIL